MERRKEARILPAQTIEATILGRGQKPVAGSVLDMSGRGLSVHLPNPVAIDAAIQLEAGDMMLLGEVRYCDPEGDGFRVGITVRHTLTHLAELRAWNRQLREQSESLTLQPAVPIVEE